MFSTIKWCFHQWWASFNKHQNNKVFVIPTLLPDFRQITSYKLSHLFALTNSNWERPPLIHRGQAGSGEGCDSIMKVFTLVISQGCNVLFYGRDCASRWEWDVFNVLTERILFVNALMSVMKLCNLKAKWMTKRLAYEYTHTDTREAKEKMCWHLTSFYTELRRLVSLINLKT